MKGAVVLYEGLDLVERFASWLDLHGVEHGAWEGEVQTEDAVSGCLFAFSCAPQQFDAIYGMPPHCPEPGVVMPDFAAVVGYGADCRSEDYFCQMMAEVARAAGGSVWVLDENNVVWDALRVDPTRVRL